MSKLVEVRQVGDGVFFAYTDVVSWVVLKDSDSVALIDAGYPKQFDAVLRSIELTGAKPSHLEAVLVTHSHVDHIGSLPALVRRYAPTVYAHPAEMPMLHGERLETATVSDVLARAWNPRIGLWGARIAMLGGTAHPKVHDVTACESGVALDLPGSPVPVPVAGHTSGHTAYLLPGAGAIALGDAIATGHPISAVRGPQLLPRMFHHDPAALESNLASLRAVDADVLLPGHGAEAVMTLSDAVDQALQRQ